MNYKNIIKKQETRFKILHYLRFIPDKLMIKLQYFIKLKKIPDLKKPKTFNEKLQWYKLYYRDPLMTICADKYEVRKYVKSKGLDYILNDLYYVINSPNEIDLEKLPDKFVIKTTNGSGTNFFCEDKEQFSLESIKPTLTKWLNRNIYASGREWAYKNITPRIIIERFLEDNNSQYHGINDFKFICFNGKAEYILVDIDKLKYNRRNVYDTNWNKVEVQFNQPNFEHEFSKPEQLDEMLKIVNKLAEGFPFVRVDLYLVNQKIYFGELTFYPGTGYLKFAPQKFDYKLGELFPNKMIRLEE